MSDFNFTDLHDSLPPEAQTAFDFHENAVQQECMPLDDQPPVERSPELFDHVVQQNSFSGNVMPLSYEVPLEQLPELPDHGAQQGIMSESAMDIDDHPSVRQSSQLYNYGTQDEIVFDPADFERDIARIEEDPQGWWVQNGGSFHLDGTIDFGSSANDPDFVFDEMVDISPSVNSTAQAPSAEPMNHFVLCGLPTNLDTTPTNGQPQQMFPPPDSGPSQYLQPPVAHYPLPYGYNWDDIGVRQSRAMASHVPQFNSNSGTGTVLEAIPENSARPPGLSSTPVQRPSNVPNLDFGARTPMTPSPSPTLQAASVKKQTTVKKHPGRTGRNQPAVPFPLQSGFLLVNGLSEAKTMANARIALDVIDDDRDLVVARPQYWVPLIAQAFESTQASKDDFLAEPDDGTRLTEEGKAEWKRWQGEHDNKVWCILNTRGEEDAPRFVQSCAYIFYDLVLEAHEQGKGLPHVGKTISNPGPNINLKCSERLNEAIAVLKNFPIVRYDFLRQDRLDGLAANPLGFVNRKIENMWVNYKKKPNTGPVKIEPVKPEPAGKKRTLSEMEQQVDANGLPTGNVDATTQPAPKRAKAAPKKHGSQATVPKSEASTPMEDETPVGVKEEDELM
jgi:hypothetical protein